MCETCFVLPSKTLNLDIKCFCCCCVSTGSTQRLAEHHSAGVLSVIVCPSEEADGNLNWRNNPERYQPVQRDTLVATAGAHFTLTYLCVLLLVALI